VNLLLQHWHGELGELELASQIAMVEYADKHGAEYDFIHGEPLGPGLAPQMHKLYALDKRFDKYDAVVVVDMDMFPRVDMIESVFDASGIGVMTATQFALRDSFHGRFPHLGDPKCDYYGGAIYRFDNTCRKLLRPFLKKALLPEFQHRYYDEGAMHVMASKAGLGGHEFLDGERWAMSSYDPNIEQAHFIHIRTKVSPTGPKVTKLENYYSLRKRWLIAA
jgi:hypothetical protein